MQNSPHNNGMPSPVDALISVMDRALRTLHGATPETRPYPASDMARDGDAMTSAERAEAAALMRVNHVGEVCAQALYEAQALGTRNEGLRQAFLHAAEEERSHLAWTERRLGELGGRTSVLNPLWYAGSFAIGFAASRLGDQVSLGFMAETERQVEHHLQSHLDHLPECDAASRAIVHQMQAEEAAHGASAMALGGAPLPAPAQWLMRGVAKVMTATAHYL